MAYGDIDTVWNFKNSRLYPYASVGYFEIDDNYSLVMNFYQKKLKLDFDRNELVHNEIGVYMGVRKHGKVGIGFVNYN